MAMLLWLGPAGLGFFLVQGLGAALSLEIINYIEHYGLARRQIDGRYERTTHQHSWNSSYLLSNLLLFQLQRHSDHHANPRRRYQALVHHDDSPQLPGGYSAMFVLALLPPLWRRIIDPRVRAYYGGASG
jgi:alkane 1-monooxygenase